MPTTIVGRGDEAELYLLHHDRLLRAVARAVNEPAALVEDACQTAWLILLRRQPDRGPTLFAWLRTVAVHEAYRLSRDDHRHARLEDLTDGGGDWEALVGTGPSLEDAIEARRALAVLAGLPALQREDLALFVAGFGYAEIARLGARRRSTNNVNKHLVKARARIRRLEQAA
jgi:DNA-directed RNA polymerase specialized sigma24 family protein